MDDEGIETICGARLKQVIRPSHAPLALGVLILMKTVAG